MLHANTDDDAKPTDPLAQSAWASQRIQRQIDSEMTALLRTHLATVFESAQDWDDLATKMAGRGYYLKPKDNALFVCDNHSHVEICRCGVLGYPSAQLKSRLGRRRD